MAPLREYAWDEGQERRLEGDLVEISKMDEMERLLSEIKSGKALSISGIHGMLTAIIIGPVVVSPDEWLQDVFNAENAMDDFVSQEHLQRLVTLVLEFYRGLTVDLSDTINCSFCIGGRTRDGRTNLEPHQWCEAFLDGTLFYKAVQAPHMLAKNAILNGYYGPMFYFGDPDGKKDLLAICKQPVRVEDLDDGFLDSLPDAIRDIREYWKKAGFSKALGKN